MAAHSPTDITIIQPVLPDQPQQAWAPWLRDIAARVNEIGSKTTELAAAPPGSGPAGPPGPTGPAGPTGATGPAGSANMSGMVAGQIPVAATATSVTASANLSGDVVSTPTTLATTIQANAITTTKILNANVTYAKIQNVTPSRILGNPTGSAAALSEISLGTNLSFAGTVLNGLATPVTVANGGTNKTSWTAGSIPFAASATALGESNTLLFWDQATSRLGVDTNAPATVVDAKVATGQHVGLFSYGTANPAVAGFNDGIAAYLPLSVSPAANAYLCETTGNVGVNTTSPVAKLHARGAAAAGTTATNIGSGPNGADASTNLILFADFAQTVAIGSITRVGTNSVGYATTSDERLKDDITDSDRGLDALMSLKVSDYRMGETHQQGLLAQQVAEHYPEAVFRGGDDPNMEPWMIDYGRLTPLLIRAIQQQQREIDRLKRRLDRQ
jgi:hypothetical protein